MTAVEQRIEKRVVALNFEGFAGVAANTAVMICADELGPVVYRLRDLIKEVLEADQNPSGTCLDEKWFERAREAVRL
jgi:hypothetical protein